MGVGHRLPRGATVREQDHQSRCKPIRRTSDVCWEVKPPNGTAEVVVGLTKALSVQPDGGRASPIAH